MSGPLMIVLRFSGATRLVCIRVHEPCGWSIQLARQAAENRRLASRHIPGRVPKEKRLKKRAESAQAIL
jgi:hypothetical protein